MTKKEKESLEKDIAKIEKRLEDMRNKLNQKDELEPYYWSSQKKSYYLDSWGDVEVNDCGGGGLLFCFDSEHEAEEYAKNLRLQSIILRLKKSLGDKHRFMYKENNYAICWSDSVNQFECACYSHIYLHTITLQTQDHAQKVCDWLNKNWDYKKGCIKND